MEKRALTERELEREQEVARIITAVRKKATWIAKKEPALPYKSVYKGFARKNNYD